MDNQQLGEWLKKRAKASGNYVSVEIDNVYNTLEALATFFYMKKHEWIAICFLDENFICKSIWFNKGMDHTQVHLGISVQEAVSHAKEIRCSFIITAHNHPISSFDRPQYNTRRENIAASYALKEAQFAFSETDETTATFWGTYLNSRKIGYAEVVLVAGDKLIQGDEEIINNFSINKAKYSKNKIINSNNGDSNYMLFFLIVIFTVLLSKFPYQVGALIPYMLLVLLIGAVIWSFK
ncbi:MAG: hypothetical protein PHI90_07330 [Clostridia bacterium]|nr:hypothetical protein [Clostridia bacterium]MDD4048613.1 hypothetical protein [Clostridia bacterium]